jgi:hypothetical protein
MDERGGRRGYFMAEKRPNKAKIESKNNNFSILYVKSYYLTHLCIQFISYFYTFHINL